LKRGGVDARRASLERTAREREKGNFWYARLFLQIRGFWQKKKRKGGERTKSTNLKPQHVKEMWSNGDAPFLEAERQGETYELKGKKAG